MTGTVRDMKRCVVFIIALLVLCGGCASKPDNVPYEPDSPAPTAHEGVFTSDHGTMTFNGDGESVELNLDGELAALTGLPEGKSEGTYAFLSGELPPGGSVPVRYDAAHELRISVNGQSAVITVGIAARDGSGASVGVGVVTAEKIPLLFLEDDKSFDITFLKED